MVAAGLNVSDMDGFRPFEVRDDLWGFYDLLLKFSLLILLTKVLYLLLCYAI